MKSRRYVTIFDESMCSISLTLWGDICQRSESLQRGDIIAFKGGRVSEYGGKSVNLADDHTTLFINPSHPRV